MEKKYIIGVNGDTRRLALNQLILEILEIEGRKDEIIDAVKRKMPNTDPISALKWRCDWHTISHEPAPKGGRWKFEATIDLDAIMEEMSPKFVAVTKRHHVHIHIRTLKGGKND